MGKPSVAVIVATRALAERADLLRAAVHSVLTQEAVSAHPIVVVNGPEADPGLLEELRKNDWVELAIRPDAGLPPALEAGRRLVRTPWFASLDDDDLLLPGALAARLEVLEQLPGSAVVVTNGYRRDGAGDVLHVTDPGLIHQDPLRALLSHNWLLPGSWLARTDQVGPDLYSAMPPFLECTYLGFRFATAYRMTYLDRPTVVWRTDTPRSVSKSPEYAEAEVPALKSIIALPMPNEIRAALEQRMTAVLHGLAERHGRQGHLREAWSYHLQSLFRVNGWRYLAFTRRLLMGRYGWRT